jgi:hypothetical protein
MSDKNHSEDSITLGGIRNFIRSGLQLLFELFGLVKTAILRNIFIILIGVLTSLLLGYGYFLSRPKFYKASMVVQNNELAKKTYGEILEQLDLLVKGGSDEELALRLGLQPATANKITFIEGRNLDDNLLSTDTSTRLKQPIKIVIGLTLPIDPVPFESAITNYLNNSPYLKKYREEQRKFNLEKLTFIDSQLNRIETTEQEYNKFLGSSRSSISIYNNAFNPAELYEYSLALYAEREKVVRWLNVDQNAIVVLDGFKPIDSPASISLFKALLIFGLLGFGIMLIIAFLKVAKEKIDHGRRGLQKS